MTNLSPSAMGLQSIGDTPIAVVDIETTGFVPGFDRVVEVAVAQIDPGSKPRLVLESLVNPRRPMAMTEIHGITAEDVADAPHFEAIAGDLAAALSGCCVVAFNANFDIRMLQWELGQLGVDLEVPYVCLRNIRSALDLGGGALEDACIAHDVPFFAGHFAAYDALSEAELFLKLQPIFAEKGIWKFGHFVNHRQKGYKFWESLLLSPLTSATELGLEPRNSCVPRYRDSESVPDTRKSLGAYHDALVAAVGDAVVTDEELASMAKLRKRFAFRPEEIRSLHAKLFAQTIAIYADDQWLADSEVRALHKLHRCLEELGWAPGNDVEEKLRT